METDQHLIPVHEFCSSHQIEVTFINTLNEFGLITVTVVETTRYIDTEQLRDLEKMIRMHYDLGINIEGIHAISHLLHLVENLHEELSAIKNRLNLYESD